MQVNIFQWDSKFFLKYSQCVLFFGQVWGDGGLNRLSSLVISQIRKNPYLDIFVILIMSPEHQEPSLGVSGNL